MPDSRGIPPNQRNTSPLTSPSIESRNPLTPPKPPSQACQWVDYEEFLADPYSLVVKLGHLGTKLMKRVKANSELREKGNKFYASLYLVEGELEDHQEKLDCCRVKIILELRMEHDQAQWERDATLKNLQLAQEPLEEGRVGVGAVQNGQSEGGRGEVKRREGRWCPS